MSTIREVHEVRPGETLSGIAEAFHVTLDQLKAANQQITNPNRIFVGDRINIPDIGQPAVANAPAPGMATVFDGIHPAVETISTNRAALILPPLTNDPAHRDPAVLDQLVNQFAVGNNPRYLPTHGNTFCNIFLWDVTRAMGNQIPHWVDDVGNIAQPFAHGASETNANFVVTWMETIGVPKHGWTASDPGEAQDFANLGKLAVVMFKNPAGHGHLAVVRPGTVTDKGPTTAQAGRHNFNSGHETDGFHDLPVKYFVNE